MKIVKSLIAVLMILGIIAKPVIVNANDVEFIEGEKRVSEFSSNEYIELKKQYEFSKNHRSLKENDIKELKKVIDKYPEYIYSLQSRNDETLKHLNYTDEQIAAIRQYDGSEEMTKAASATVSGTLTHVSRTYNSSTNKTTVKIKAEVQWNGTPVVKGTDSLGIALVGSNANFIKSSAFCSVKYHDGSIVNSTYYQDTLGKGIVYRFGITRDSLYVFTKATLTYTAVAGANVTVYGYAAAYAHYTVGITNSFGLSISNSGIGITFTVANQFVKMWEQTKTKT